MKWKLGCIVLSTVILFSTVALAVDPKACSYDGRKLIDIYDANAEPQKRDEMLRALRSAADSNECPASAYALGQLYRHGPDLPGNLLARDTQRAHALLLQYAEEGHLRAYADLAEMLLKDGRSREAMKWVQVYLYFLARYDKNFERDAGSFDRTGYNADLLMRADSAWRKSRPALKREWITTDLREYLDSHKSLLVSKVEHEKETSEPTIEEAPEQPRVKRFNRDCSVDLGGITGGYATYLVEVQPDGNVSRVVLENFAPHPRVGERLKRCAESFEFEALMGAKPTVARVPVIYGYLGGSMLRFKNSDKKK